MEDAVKVYVGFALFFGAMYFVSDLIWRALAPRDGELRYLPQGLSTGLFLRLVRVGWLVLAAMGILLAVIASLARYFPGIIYVD